MCAQQPTPVQRRHSRVHVCPQQVSRPPALGYIRGVVLWHHHHHHHVIIMLLCYYVIMLLLFFGMYDLPDLWAASCTSSRG
jgi:hypothetical protein